MPDSLAPSVWPAWLDDIDGLVARLRSANMPIGVGDELRLRVLVGRLRVQGLPADSADSVARWLGPILCRNTDHQVALLRVLRAIEADHLPHRRFAADVAPQTEQEGAIAARAGRDRWRIATWVGATLLLAIGVSVWLMLAPAATTPGPTTGPTGTPQPGAVTSVPVAADTESTWWSYELGLIPMIVALTFLMIRRRRRSFLMRGLVPRDLPTMSIPLPAAAVGLFRPDRMRMPAADWRRHRWEDWPVFDPVRSVERTVRAGGEPTIVNGRRRVLPEYVLLVDRAGAGDHLATVADHLTRRLKAEQVDVMRFDYRGDPRRLAPIGAPGGSRQRRQTLEELQSKRQSHQLIVLADPASAFDHATRQPRAWLRPLAEWPRPIWMSPMPATQHGAAERRLQRHGFEIVETSAEGAADVGRLMRRDDRLAPRASPPDRESSLDLTLAVDSYLWTGERSPSEDEIATLLKQLELALEPQAFALLAAIAVFPMTDSRLTLYAAAQLSRSERWTNVLEPLVCQVSRLPWLRQGRLPEWLRAALVEWLERRENAPLAETIRVMWLQLLERDADDAAVARGGDATSEPVRLEFVRTHAKTVGEKRMQDVVDKNRKGYEERVLLAFLTQTPIRQVVFEAPTDWRDLAPRRWTALEAIVVGIGVVVAAAMVGWSGVLKAWLLVLNEKASLGLLADATLTAVGLSFLVVLASYLRQFEPWSRLLNGTAIAIFSAATAIPGIALVGIAASHGRIQLLDDKAVQTFLILMAPVFSYAILWLSSSSSLRFPAYASVTALFRRWPISCALAATIVIFTLSFAATFAVHAAAFNDSAWRLTTSPLEASPRFLFGSSGILAIALALICSLHVSLARLVDVSVPKAMLVASALVHVLSAFGCMAIIAVVGWPSLPSDYGGVAVVVMMAIVMCAPLAVARWRSLDGSTVRFVYCLIGIALALEIAKAAAAGLMGGWYDQFAALPWFVPALLPAYLVAHRLFLQPRLSGTTVGNMVLIAVGLLAMGALAVLAIVPLAGLALQDAVLTSIPALTMGLEAGGFLLALRYGSVDWAARGVSNGLPGTTKRTSELLAPLLKAVWPILVLVPASLGVAGLGAEMKSRDFGSANFGSSPTSFTVTFDRDSTSLPSSAEQTLRQVAEAIKARADRVVVTGYADSDTPSSSDGQRLGEARATVVRDDLLRRGVPRDAITMQVVRDDRRTSRVDIVLLPPGTPAPSAPRSPPMQQQTVPSKK
jgi:hypothetical protein